MSEILKNVGIHIVCEHCETEFVTSADVVAESQQLLDDGCPGESHECPARLFANFVDRDALRDLADAWQRVRTSINAPAVDLKLTSQKENGAAETEATNPSVSPAPGTVTFTVQDASEPDR